jgi:peptidoglycan hydrolase-like protein with peptidoglycan-binding domain
MTNRSTRTARLPRAIAAVLCLALFAAACGSSGGTGSVDAAQARVTSKQRSVADAQQKYDAATTAFCADTKTYIEALDRYGKVFEQSAATVGDVKTAGADLANPRASVSSSANGVTSAADELATAKRELADAQAALAAAQSGTSAAATSSPASTTTTIVPPATIDRVKQAEADLQAASNGITDQTPVAKASVEYNSAAFALEVAWLRLFADAGCLTDEQQVKAEAAVHDYTVALQNALRTTGYYAGAIDGVYGPATADAVKKLQQDHGLPVSGYVDRATAAALSSAVASKGGAVASSAIAHTAAVQSTLKLAGYWTGAVDGHWTPELTDALKKFQTDLGVAATGEVDVATLSALEAKIAAGKVPATTTVPASTSTSVP